MARAVARAVAMVVEKREATLEAAAVADAAAPYHSHQTGAVYAQQLSRLGISRPTQRPRPQKKGAAPWMHHQYTQSQRSHPPTTTFAGEFPIFAKIKREFQAQPLEARNEDVPLHLVARLLIAQVPVGQLVIPPAAGGCKI